MSVPKKQTLLMINPDAVLYNPARSGVRFAFSLWNYQRGLEAQYLYTTSGVRWTGRDRTRYVAFRDHWRRYRIPFKMKIHEVPKNVSLRSTPTGRTTHRLELIFWQVSVPFRLDLGFEMPRLCETGKVELLAHLPEEKASPAHMSEKVRRIIEVGRREPMFCLYK